MSLISDIVGELADTLEAALEAEADFEIAVNTGMYFNPTTTAIDIYPDDPFRDPLTAGHGDVNGGYRFVIRARTGLNDLDSGQEILMDLMDDEQPYSPAVALSVDPTLNGMAQDVFVDGPSGFLPFRDLGGEGTMAGVTWSVLVLAAHS